MDSGRRSKRPLNRDGYLERSTSGTSNNSSYTPASDTSTYDALECCPLSNSWRRWVIFRRKRVRARSERAYAPHPISRRESCLQGALTRSATIVYWIPDSTATERGTS